MKLEVPEPSLVLLVGPSGSGKSTFGRRHFKETEILSSDFCRGMVADDPNDQTATTDAFDVLHFITRKRLDAGRLTVIDATNVQREARASLIRLAKETNHLAIAIVFALPSHLCHERNAGRADRQFGPHVVNQQHQQLRRSLRDLQREGFRHVYQLRSVEEVDAAAIERRPLWNNRKDEHGPFDIIGDVHGCTAELTELLRKLGYDVDDAAARHRDGRRVIFLGDLVDRGPDTPGVLRRVMAMTAAGTALCVPGNHDIKLMRKLRGANVRITHGLAQSLEQLETESDEFRQSVVDFIDSLTSHYVLDDGRLVVAHAGMKAAFQGRASGRVREFALYGETTGETDEYGLPVRYDWAADYRGKAMVVYGHTPVPEPEWLNNTICVDTGCVFGGYLTALRYPERELVQVRAAQTYYESAKPFLPAGEAPPAAERPRDDLLDIGDVMGKRIVSTRLHRTVTIREENACAALEVMSRFAVDPRWLIYLPPTMSPSETCAEGPYLEHPSEAFAHYRNRGVPQVICEEKHMGSRAIVVLCRGSAAARRRFGVTDERIGIAYTRTGRPFFPDLATEGALLARLAAAVERAGLWSNLGGDWLCLDCELMPWSAKAQALLRSQYAATATAAEVSLARAVAALEATGGEGADELLTKFRERRAMAAQYRGAYRPYCWSVNSVDDLKLAPFHLLASEGQVHADKDHGWHMQTLAGLAAAEPRLVVATRFQMVNLIDPASEEAAIAWWEALTLAGGEGMVVKPMDWIVHHEREMVQPALKCRGREYLRLIYGPEYSAPGNLDRLRARGLGRKRSLALREFALGLEALHRFVQGEPLYRVHECVFGVLALESEPVDPRL